MDAPHVQAILVHRIEQEKGKLLANLAVQDILCSPRELHTVEFLAEEDL